tara:strand:+ start:291 stop:1136 length:846 start_codon:yes stop_codon:yes gene_type:complete
MIGIIGMGYVGSALKAGFSSQYSIETYDLNSALSSCQSVDELVSKSKIIFLCLPTPMKKSGACDLSIIEGVLNHLNQIINKDSDKIIVIKSTIVPGSTDRFNNEFDNLNIIFNPEFLTEANFIEDFKNQKRIILGGSKNFTVQLKEIYTKIFPKAKIIETQSKQAEMVKYFANTFLATKVSFANEMKIICDKFGIDYNEIVEYAIYDDRLGNSHWSVPGPDGKLGFGGSCFPKDINALISVCSDLDLDVLKAVWGANLKVRPERDWEELKGRAISTNSDEI